MKIDELQELNSQKNSVKKKGEDKKRLWRKNAGLIMSFFHMGRSTAFILKSMDAVYIYTTNVRLCISIIKET